MDRVTPTPLPALTPVARQPRRRELAFGAALLAVGLLIGVAAGPASAALSHVGGDKLFWTASRLTAFLAYLAFAGSVCYGLGMASGIIDAVAGRPVSFALHQDLALAGLALSAAHVFLLLGDRYIGFDLVTLLVPGLSPYRSVPVAVGQVAAWAALATVLSFYVRGRMPAQLWRKLHAMSTVVFILATGHGLYTGTDSRMDLIWWVYVAVGLVVLFLFAYRIAADDQRNGRSARPGA
jgi:predicted ferric reductase